MASGRGTISWDREGVGEREILKNDRKFTFWAIFGQFFNVTRNFSKKFCEMSKKKKNLHFFGVREGVK